ncbi:uncharacterized protein N7479_003359 [Penicillium vulpinum]|uniref:Uncharacterized protein n=1 Tax=Penicillium vulpinum TaxID=29845 RepID=A0A1V6S3I7_9EURO|nr:uncharacterized protein N7479_003359 [Penicillium vulpinum]KAJ5963483.1 hypothetical protein N7479_003359 [Penicillium vulpinum]OQE08602.1 hypothetical protein PENVUL_c009G01397 [Penicillium vulpinum]
MGEWQNALHYGMKFRREDPYVDSEAQNREAKQAYDEWCNLFHNYLSAGADIHHLVDGTTPFLAYLHGFGFFSEYPSKALWVAAVPWLKALQANGIDLKQFGKRELGIWGKEDVHRATIDESHGGLYIELTGLLDGLSIEDWLVLFVALDIEFVRISVEEAVQDMPGAWPDP